MHHHISNGEYLISIFLKQAFPKYNFVLCKPNWLINPITKGIMELDFYCEELNLALEYQGIFHFPNDLSDKEPTERMLKRTKSLLDNDVYKKIICEERHIVFITINYDLNYANVKNVRNFLYNELIKYKYDISEDFLNMKIPIYDCNLCECITEEEGIDPQDKENFLENILPEEFIYNYKDKDPKIYLDAINRLLIKISLFSTRIRILESENKNLNTQLDQTNFSRNILFRKIDELNELKENALFNQ